jgi:hypothetical protein
MIARISTIAELGDRVLGGDLDRLVQVPAVDQVEAAHLLLGLGERARRWSHLAARRRTPVDSAGGGRAAPRGGCREPSPRPPRPRSSGPVLRHTAGVVVIRPDQQHVLHRSPFVVSLARTSALSRDVVARLQLLTSGPAGRADQTLNYPGDYHSETLGGVPLSFALPTGYAWAYPPPWSRADWSS